MANMINIEVAFALPNEQKIITLQVEEGTTIYDAAKLSGIDQKFPQIDLDSYPMGIFGKGERKPKEVAVKEGQRIEIYRPLIADPKEVRARRAAKMKAQKEAEETGKKSN